MIIDFFKADCRQITYETKFGICDEDDKNPAFIDSSVDETKWIAIVLNKNAKKIVFTAIDNCIEILRESGDKGRRCDVMLTCDDSLFLVELKNKISDWKSTGIDQIEATLINLIENHEAYYYRFKKRKAYVANKRHPNFHVIENETMRMFSTKYKIWLDIRAEIIIP